jgi:hypothetical protein
MAVGRSAIITNPVSVRLYLAGIHLLGPLLGGVILSNLECPWLFSVLLIICGVAITGGFFLLKETYVPVLPA